MKHAFLFVAVLGAGCARAPAPSRVPALEAQLASQKFEGEHAVIRYGAEPQRSAPDLNELTTPAADVLGNLPGVVDVEVLVKVEKPRQRVIHLRDWHLVPPAGAKGAELKLDELRLEAELVQLEQAAVLRCLAKRHGLRTVLAEGLTDEGLANYEAIAAAFEKSHRKLAELKAQRNTLKSNQPDMEAQLQSLARSLSHDLTEYGAAMRLRLREHVAVLPLDDGKLLDAARPGADGVSAQALAAREDEQVRRARASGPVALLILGGDHDLSAAVKRVGGGVTEYIRVTTRRYREFAGR